ncbi:MAG TPA: GNAT family N-acetyltransferase [Acidimicrobiales bacterium]|nr:GNAT family N-acetyltransferase [Acidimicrobiales bacterium]
MASQETSRVFVRPYRPEDREAVYDICVRTGDDGADATGKFEYPEILPDTYTGPYLFLQPDLAFVLAADDRAVGYVLGTANTQQFVEAYLRNWLPKVAANYPSPPPRPATPDEGAIARLYQPEQMLRPWLEEYPAHLHIDVLPPYQGAGHGRRLIETFFAAASGAGAPGAHVGVSAGNGRAHGFYLKVGFQRLPAPYDPSVVYYGHTLSPPAGPAQAQPAQAANAAQG